MASGTTGDIQNPPPRPEANRPADEPHGAGRIGIVTMRIQAEVVFTEPLFEPFSHGSGDS
jgi:hypothetical protein